MIVLGKAKRVLVVVNGLLVVVVVLVLASLQESFDDGGGGGEVMRGKCRGWSAAPGAFLLEETPQNQTFCTFAYDLPLRLRYKEADVAWTPGGRYRVLYNALRSAENESNELAVTYATHLTPEFTPYLPEVLKVWEGPVSVAAFVPATDAVLLLHQVVRLCRCLSDMSRVSVHFVFPEDEPPRLENATADDAATPTPAAAPDSYTCALPHVDAAATFRKRDRRPYPVNACRNVARSASTTELLLVSDVELIPSVQLVSRFQKVAPLKHTPRRVFVVPVFEVDKDEAIPKTKKELLQLVHAEKANYFHRHICLHCQKFPGIEIWLSEDPRDVVKIFKGTTRTYPYHRWEPIFIGTKNEPLYREDLSWEGKQDKMIQMLEMCLIGYRFLILDGAFLVHWPGIKRNTRELRKMNKWRTPYELKNSRQYNNISKHLTKQYSHGNKRCKA